MSISKLILASLICILLITGCQQNIQSTVEAEVALAVAATVEALPTHTARPTLTPYPTFTPLPTDLPAGPPTMLPTLTARPTYTPYPTYTPETVLSPTANSIASGSSTANAGNAASSSANTAVTFSGSLMQVTYAQMAQILKSVSGYVDTYEDDDPDDLQSGEGGRQKVPVNCSTAINQFQQLLQLEVKSLDSQNPNEQAAFGSYRQAWDRYMGAVVPIIERCQTAVANNETLETLGRDLYGAALRVLHIDVNVLINQAISTLGENQ